MLSERDFDSVPAEQKEVLRQVIADATGQDVRKIGDGTILALLMKLLPLLLQFAPLFMTKEESERKIGDGTLLAAFLAALSNPQFVQNIAGLIALIQSLFPAKV